MEKLGILTASVPDGCMNAINYGASSYSYYSLEKAENVCWLYWWSWLWLKSR